MQGKKRPSAQDAVPPGHVHCFIPGYAVGRSVVLSLVATKGGNAHGRPRRDAGTKARASMRFPDSLYGIGARVAISLVRTIVPRGGYEAPAAAPVADDDDDYDD